MNRRSTLKTEISGLLLLVMFLTNILRPAPADSLAFYQMQYGQQLEKLSDLEKQYIQLKTNIDGLDAQIIKLNTVKNPNWTEKRKLTRLTARKAGINDEMIRIFTELAAQNETLTATFNRYYAYLSISIDANLDQYGRLNDQNQRQNLSRDLIELVEHRGQILATRSRFPAQGKIPLPEKDDLVALISKYDRSAAIRKDVSHILDDKIRQIDLMIAAANTEKELRKRLNQLNLEMSALTGEAYSNRGGQVGDRGTKTANDSYGSWGSNPSSLTNDAEYANYTSNASFSATIQPLTAADYLPLFQKIQTNDLPLYITRLDSLRRYYQKQLLEINGNK